MASAEKHVEIKAERKTYEIEPKIIIRHTPKYFMPFHGEYPFQDYPHAQPQSKNTANARGKSG